jgi:hypothetical protein
VHLQRHSQDEQTPHPNAAFYEWETIVVEKKATDFMVNDSETL